MSEARKLRLAGSALVALVLLVVTGSVLTGTYEPEVGGAALLALVIVTMAHWSIRPTTKAPKLDNQISGAFARKG